MDLPLIFWDRSRRELDQKCARARYYSTEFGAKGLQPRQKGWALLYGGAVHVVNEVALRGGDWLEALQRERLQLEAIIRERRRDLPDAEPIAREWGLLFQGHILGWQRVVRPILERDYRLLSVERSFGWAHAPGMLYATKPDVMLERRDDESTWYMEWKTTSKADSKWLDSWNYDAQLQLGAAAYAAVTGRPVRGCIVQGLLKGRVEADDHLSSPLIYGWHLPADPPLTPEQWGLKRPASWKGWKRVDIDSTFPGGQPAWIEQWGEQLLEVFPQTPPILLNEDVLRGTLQQAEWREREIDAARLLLTGDSRPEVKQLALDRFFPQTFKQCSPAWGEACDFLSCCWQPEIGADPLASGLYEVRVPHHDLDPAGED